MGRIDNVRIQRDKVWLGQGVVSVSQDEMYLPGSNNIHILYGYTLSEKNEVTCPYLCCFISGL